MLASPQRRAGLHLPSRQAPGGRAKPTRGVATPQRGGLGRGWGGEWDPMFMLEWSVAHRSMRENVFAGTDGDHFSLPAVRDWRGSRRAWPPSAVAGRAGDPTGRGGCSEGSDGWRMTPPLSFCTCGGGGRGVSLERRSQEETPAFSQDRAGVLLVGGSPSPREDASRSFLGLQPVPSHSPGLPLFHRLSFLLPAY